MAFADCICSSVRRPFFFGRIKRCFSPPEANRRAVKCYLGCGFREEGRLRQALFLEGRYVDALIMGAVREDWTQPVP